MTTPELEKQADYNHVDQQVKNELDEDIDHGFSPKEQKSIIRRIDRRLVLTVGALYCVSLMDRTNMSNANIAGMGVELVLIDFRYVSILSSRGRERSMNADETCRISPTWSSLSRTSSSSRPPPSSSARSAPASISPPSL